VSLGDIYKSVWPFLAIMVLCIVLVMIFPGIALWFPSLIE
jgi:TRAP-type mannitol/chloroaromatic compound transport system permease large subunit